MSEVHDKIIADKESKIANLDARLKAKENALLILKDNMDKSIMTTNTTVASLRDGTMVMDAAAQLAEGVSQSVAMINDISNKLLKTMRDTKASMIFETQQLKNVAADAKHFKESASDLKAAVELINSIRPTIKELMNNPDELNVIKEIIHACQSTTKNRERSETSTDKQTGTTPDVQVR